VPRAANAPPPRLVAAVEGLPAHPDHRVLEVGCGRGVAAELICRRLDGGRLVAIDRSAAAVAAAATRNVAHVAAGTATFVVTDLRDVDPASLGRFDAVLAVDVNLFWTRPAQRELALVAELLAPEGLLRLVFSPPGVQQVPRLEQALGERLDAAGFTWTPTTATSPAPMLTVVARPRSRERPSPGSGKGL
jgi:SAM-dependent methyltransferase